ncbi:hypothetical protein [Labilibaculum euxinus]
MKKKLFVVCVLLATIGVISSCEKENSTLTPKNKLLVESEIKNIGVRHNEALDCVLLKLQKHAVGDPGQKKQETSTAIAGYIKGLYPANEHLLKVAKDEEFRIDEHSNSSNLKSSNSLLVETINSNNEFLSHAQTDILLDCNDILTSSDNDVNNTIAALDVLQETVKSLPEDDQYVISAALEIAEQSAKYWSDNLNDWETALNGDDFTRTKGWFSFKNVVIADVAGAVSGAVYAAIANAIPGAGQVAYGASILTAAAAGSAYNAVDQILQHYCSSSTATGCYHVSYFTENPKYMREAHIIDRSKIAVLNSLERTKPIDVDNIVFYYDSYGTIESLSEQKITKLYAYTPYVSETYAATYPFLTIPLEEYGIDRTLPLFLQHSNKSVSRRYIGGTASENIVHELEVFDPHDGGHVMN